MSNPTKNVFKKAWSWYRAIFTSAPFFTPIITMTLIFLVAVLFARLFI